MRQINLRTFLMFCHDILQAKFDVLKPVAAQCGSSESTLAILQCEDAFLNGSLDVLTSRVCPNRWAVGPRALAPTTCQPRLHYSTFWPCPSNHTHCSGDYRWHGCSEDWAALPCSVCRHRKTRAWTRSDGSDTRWGSCRVDVEPWNGNSEELCVERSLLQC
jgi:hypothetical protein